MIPSLVAQEIKEGIRQFLVTGFEPTNATFNGIVKRFVDNPGNVSKGPYLSLGLPFRKGSARRDFFSGFQTEHPPFLHQELAWKRLRSNGNPLSTLVATGTGSGKTECFEFPVFDHCLREKQAGRTNGIKALVIYPMNALGADQARRFAEAIHNSPELNGQLRVGLFVGDGEGGSAGTDQMSSDSVITSKEAMRRDPPDILLTNYKMLDYLLIRPKDQALWRFNGPETLRYLVVDELHTFDGAQGTDLALLIRRIKARLKTPVGYMICAGTSATLGDADQATGLLSYAKEIFAEPFDDNSVVIEDRLSMVEFLAGAIIEYQFSPPANLGEILEPRRYATMEDAVIAWHQLFFPEDQPARPSEEVWRAELGSKLKGQLQFNNLLRLLDSKLRPYEELVHEFPRFLPSGAKEHAERILDALLTLVAWARDPEKPALPFVQLKLQLWLREQRRMVVRLTNEQDSRILLSADDPEIDKSKVYLPLVQCSDCLSSAWLTRIQSGEQRVGRDLRTIYDSFFSHREDMALLYPQGDVRENWLRGERSHVCGSCGQIQATKDRCLSCGAEDIVPVFRPLTARQVTRREVVRVESEHICPVCGSEESLRLFGARSTSLSSVIIEHLWGSSANDHRKLIAFSDSVQDSAHRAGFFSARTYANNARAAVTQSIHAWTTNPVPWRSYLHALPTFWLDLALNPEAMSKERFVVEFIGPNMTWFKDYEDLCKNGALSNDWLLGAVSQRLQWEAFAEFSYLSRRNRSIENVGAAALGIDPGRVSPILPGIEKHLREDLGISNLDAVNLQRFVWGFLFHLKHRGAVEFDAQNEYIKGNGRSFLLNRSRSLPNFGPHSTRPLLLCLGAKHPEFDTIESTSRITWYQKWIRKALVPDDLLKGGIDRDIYSTVCSLLAKAGVLKEYESDFGLLIALAADALFVEPTIERMITSDGGSEVVVPRSIAELFVGMPSLDMAVPGVYGHSDNDEHWKAHLYKTAKIRRVIAAEHTGLLERDEREALERRFKSEGNEPWNENLLSATPTLEMGVDIGSLSSVLLCSVPPSQANYLQRIGRPGRRDGNALALTVAAGRPHDLYFYARPEEMMSGPVQPPGVFLNASAVLFRQMTSFCLDGWVATGIDQSAMPVKLSPVIDAVEKYASDKFPYNFISYVEANAAALLESFCKLLEGSITDRTKKVLEEFMFGTMEDDGLRVRLIKRIEALVKERASLTNRAKVLKNEIDKLKKGPMDEVTQVRIEEAKRERDAILEINRNTNARDLLNFLTDEGLIPNYAFPEEGVTLRSVLWRRRQEVVEGESPYENWVVEYQRPAAAALTELAPLNCFFAGKRRVQVDQVDLGLSPIENWRLCPSCSHAENLAHGDHSPTCPRCGDVQWQDVGQIFNLVRLRHVLANTEDRKSRIDDGSDDRDLQFYSRQLMPDFVRADVQFAYRLASDAVPFGFEFVRRVAFRDFNFGKVSTNGNTTTIGGREAVRNGFRLCKHCGKVQSGGGQRREGGEEKQIHAYDCPMKDRNDPKAIVECLSLYREFNSEALRILLPVTQTETDPTAVSSLTAAIRLGLKLRFGGKVDHLQIINYDEPDAANHVSRHYLMVYDSVPGGTGYLYELLREPARLFEVFELARKHMMACSCNHDQELDGCYRCLFAYRQSQSMHVTSRDSAVRLLTEIIDSRERLEAVETLSDILINPNFESALEARVIEAFKRASVKDATVRIQQDVVGGKLGYRLSVGENEYTIRAQENVGASDGVAVASKPDFVIRPALSKLRCRPVAIFADGFEYHKQSITDDSLKRMALIQSGRYWVWSLTWQDIQDALENSAEKLQPMPPGPQAGNAAKISTALGCDSITFGLKESPFAQLIAWLRQPDEALWRGAVFSRALSWAQPGADTPHAKDTRDWIEKIAPTPMREAIQWEGVTLSGTVGSGTSDTDPDVRWLTPGASLKPIQPELIAILLCLNSALYPDEKDLRVAWRWFWSMGNLTQFLPRMALVTPDGVANGIYEQVGWKHLDGKAQSQPIAPEQGPELGEWAAVIDEAVPEAGDGLLELSAADVPTPHVGYELQDDKGAIVAEAELAWPSAKLVVLRVDQSEFDDRWQHAGWSSVSIGDGWVDAVTKVLKGV